MVCKICGHTAKHRLIDHIVKTHKMKVEDYKKEYGDVISKENREQLKERAKKNWRNKEFREKQKITAKTKYTKEVREKIRRKTKENYISGKIKVWNRGLTKEKDERLENIGAKNRKHLTGRTKEHYEYLQKNSDRLKGLPFKNCFSQTANAENLLRWKKKISETLTRKILAGEINGKSNFKSGWYSSDGNPKRAWYQSSLELEAMKLFDGFLLNWIKSPQKIPYVDKNGTNRNYLPDFRIDINGVEFLIEMKGYPDEDLEEKSKAAKVKYGERFIVFWNVKTLKEFIEYEISKNTKDKQTSDTNL